MEGGHLAGGGEVGAVDLHLLVEAVGKDEVVGELQTGGLHGVGGTVVMVTNL